MKRARGRSGSTGELRYQRTSDASPTLRQGWSSRERSTERSRTSTNTNGPRTSNLREPWRTPSRRQRFAVCHGLRRDDSDQVEDVGARPTCVGDGWSAYSRMNTAQHQVQTNDVDQA